MREPGRPEKRIPELLEFAGLSDFTERLAGRLSGGMKKKLALACSLIHEPQVVMLDEPTLGVDPSAGASSGICSATCAPKKG